MLPGAELSCCFQEPLLIGSLLRFGSARPLCPDFTVGVRDGGAVHPHASPRSTEAREPRRSALVGWNGTGARFADTANKISAVSVTS